jgi:hypothetical protein
VTADWCIREMQQSRTSRDALSQWNGSSHATRHGHDCPSALAMQQSGGADLTVALHR